MLRAREPGERGRRRGRRTSIVWVACLIVSSCVYYNAMYDIERAYDRAVDEQRAGRDGGGANAQYDSVITWSRKLMREHPDSEHAAPAALLKARSELARGLDESAATTAASVAELTDDPTLLATAAGLEGVARQKLEEPGAAEALLTRALEGAPTSEDRAQFHFHRGVARLALGNARGAADDLSAASEQEELTAAVRLDLARALADVGQHEVAVDLTTELVRENRFASFGPGMDPHLDSLVVRAPALLEEAFDRQLDEGDLTPTKQALLRYYGGRAREVTGDREGARARFDSARAGDAGRSRYAAEAAYRWSRLRILEAGRPNEVIATREALLQARAVPDAEVAEDVERLASAVEEFASLVEAYETRGATAAEAALRAAEIAGADLGARRVARGLYLTYLELAPDSRWRAKAIAGAMLHADWPAGEWAGDRGAVTDERLRTRLAALPSSDPYRVSLQDLPRTAGVDSAYVEAERELRRRLTQIRMLYDTTAVLVDPGAEDAPEDEGDEGEDAADDQADEPEVEF